MSYLLLKKTWRDIWLKKWLVLTLAIVVALACAAYVGMSSIYDDLKYARDQYYQLHNLADFGVQAKAIPKQEIKKLKKLDNVSQLAGRIRSRVTFSQLGSHSNLVSGEAFSIADTSGKKLNGLHLESGRFPKPHSHQIAVLAQFATAHHLHVGQRLHVIFSAGEREMQIVGVVYSPEQVMVLSPDALPFAPQEKYFGVIYLSQSTLADLVGLPQQVNEVLVSTKSKDPAAVLKTMESVSKALFDYGVLNKELVKNKPSVNMLDAEIENIKVTATVFPFIFLLVGALVINVLLQRLVKQQQKSIGVLKALGYTRFQLLMHYISYGILIGVVGSFVGIVLGIWIQRALVSLYADYFKLPNLSAHLYSNQILIGVFVGLFSSVSGSLISAIKVMRLSIANAMGSHVTDTRFSLRLWKTSYFKRLPFYWKMAFRSVFRERFRSAVGVFTIIISVSLVYMALNIGVSMLDMVDLSTDHINHYDASISLRHLVGESYLDSFKRLPGVKRIETQLNLPVTLKSSHYRREIVIDGLASSNRLYTPLNQFGYPIHIPAQGLVISRTLSRLLHVGVGGKVELHPLLGHREMILVPVVKVIKTYIGLPVYANQLWLSHELDSELAYNRVLVTLRNSGANHAFNAAASAMRDVTNIQYAATIKKDIVELLEQTMGGFIAVIILFAATIAIASLYNNAMVSLNERQKDIATFTVLGLSRWEIFRIFLSEGIILLILGLVLGAPSAYYLNRLLMMAFQTEFYRFPIVLYLPELIKSLLLILIFFMLSYCVVMRYIWKTRWLSLLNVRE